MCNGIPPCFFAAQEWSMNLNLWKKIFVSCLLSFWAHEMHSLGWLCGRCNFSLTVWVPDVCHDVLRFNLIIMTIKESCISITALVGKLCYSRVLYKREKKKKQEDRKWRFLFVSQLLAYSKLGLQAFLWTARQYHSICILGLGFWISMAIILIIHHYK